MRSKVGAFAVAAMVVVAVIAASVLAGDDVEIIGDVAAPSPAPTAAESTNPTPEAFKPTFAPDGRSGIAEVDWIIDNLVGMTATELSAEYPDVTLREFTGVEDLLLTASEWAARLDAAERSLFAVVREPEGSGIFPAREVNIILSVTAPAGEATGWRIAVERGRIVDMASGSARSISPASYTREIGFNYERFLVLPPRDELPQVTSSHALNTRTNVPGVDRLISILESHDGDELVASGFKPVAFSRCRTRQPEREDVATRRLSEIGQQVIGVHSVVELPVGYLPVADHMLLMVLEISPYRWSMAALIERDGAIVGFDLCETDRPESLYPPQAYPVPPVADLADLDPARRSGIEPIDMFLDALAASDLSALLGRVDYKQVACVREQRGIGGPPLCGEGEPEGTLVDVVIFAQCEGHYVRRQDMAAPFSLLLGKSWALYSVVQPGPPSRDSFTPGIWQAILVDLEAAADSFQRSISPWFNEAGLSGFLNTCGQANPGDVERSGTAPAFLLPPP